MTQHNRETLLAHRIIPSRLWEIVEHLERVATQARDENVIVPLNNGNYLGIRFDHLLAVLAEVRAKGPQHDPE